MALSLLARGVYEHRESGVANGISEMWRWERDTQDEHRITVEFDALALGTKGYRLSATITVIAHRITTLRYQYSDGVSGHYHLDGDTLHVERILQGHTHLADRFVLPPYTLLDSPFLSTKGHTILSLLERQSVRVYAPLLRLGARAGDLARQVASVIGTTTMPIAQAQVTARHIRYRRDYWLDEYGMVLRTRDGDYEMILTEYER